MKITLENLIVFFLVSILSSTMITLHHYRLCHYEPTDKTPVPQQIRVPVPPVEDKDEAVIPIALEMEVTAYCPCEICCGSYSDGITASGYKIRLGDRLIAAPPSFRFGTKIYIPGYGMASVKDRGGAITKNRLDVFFHSHEEALQWGRQILLVTIYEGE